jgi:para-nitrobenzyl esterase
VDGTVSVDGGWVRGVEDGGVWAFLGVPYARAPVGPLRWRAPERPEPWSGVRDTCDPGPIAPQLLSPASTLPGDPVEQSEDCLHLSIWTPAPDASRRPVLVWVHPGGFTSGSAGRVLYRGQRLAADGDVVVVNVNYRLGALGFLAHRALGEGADRGRVAGNWALLDQIAALRWVRDHIASFGGDPSSVTLFGESAGAMCISALLTAPSARGLFGGAAIQSGPPYAQSSARAEEEAVAFVHELGVRQVTREALESVPAADLVAALDALSRRDPRPGELPQPLLPVVDGTTLLEPPLQAIARGAAAGIATIVGTNRDEMTFFALTDPTVQEMDDVLLEQRISRSTPRVSASRVVGHYREVLARRGEPVSPRDLWVAAGTDIVFRWPTMQLAAALGAHDPRTFAYLFTWESPAFGGVLGATHALEIPFVFGTHRDPGIARFVGEGRAVDELSAAMQSSWVSFARRRDPSSAEVGKWPPWERERRSTMVFGPIVSLQERPRDEELTVWETVAPLPGQATDPSG